MRFRLLDYNYLWQTGTTVTATSEDPSFPVSNLDHPSRSRVWRSADGVLTASVVIDIGTPDVVDTAVVFFDPIRALPVSTGASITLDGDSNGTFVSPDFTTAMVLDADAKAARVFLPAQEEYRYWRVTITEPSLARSFVEIGKLVLGASTELSVLPGIGFGWEMNDQSKVERNDYGHEYTDIYPVLRSLDLSYAALPYADAQKLELLYRRVGKALPIVAAIDPEGELYGPNHFLVYGKVSSPFALRHVTGNAFSHSMSIREVI